MLHLVVSPVRWYRQTLSLPSCLVVVISKKVDNCHNCLGSDRKHIYSSFETDGANLQFVLGPDIHCSCIMVNTRLSKSSPMILKYPQISPGIHYESKRL